MAVEGLGVVKDNIRKAISRQEVAMNALCFYYAGLALQEFRKLQGQNEFWNNQTGTAYSTVFSGLIQEKNEIGFFLAHMVEYGLYLELANDRAHEALRPTLIELSSDFYSDVKDVFGA